MRNANSVGVAVIGGGLAGRAHAAGYRTASTLFSTDRPDVRLVAIADVNRAVALVDAIKSGQVQWAVDQQPFLQGYLAIDSLWLYLNNRNTISGGRPTLTGPAFIDKSNIDAIAEYAKNGTR